MKRAGWVVGVVLAMVCMAAGQARSFRGTVVRMKMSECTRQHGFISAMSGTQIETTQACPEYTVMSDRVVYVIVGRKSEEFIPLAENVIFHLRRSDVVVISEDEKEQSHFAIRQMVLREDWDRGERDRDQQNQEVRNRPAERSVGYEPYNASRTGFMKTISH